MNFSRLTLLSLCCVLSSSLLSHAAVPIERRTLSSNIQATADPATVANSLPIAPLLEPNQPSVLWQLTEQVQQLQEEVRRLRGNNESQEQRLDTLEKELQSRFIDFDQRLEQLQEQLRSKLSNPDTNSDELEPANPNNSDSTTQSERTNNTASMIPPPPINAATSSSTDKNPPTTASAAEQRAYIAAYDAYKAGGTQKAIIAMEQFIQDYPNSVYIPNAHYWLGEFFITLTPPNLANAQKEFNVVMATYPRSARAAAAIYRLASIAEVEKRSSEATRLMNILLNDYAGSTEAGYAQDFLNKRRN